MRKRSMATGPDFTAAPPPDDAVAAGRMFQAGVGVPLTPFRQFVVKLHSRCNIACDHCYMYELADQSWRARPMVMSDADIDRLAARVAEHAHAHSLDSVEVLVHGGEPLLAGKAKLERLFAAVTAALRPNVRPVFTMQTNGILLTEAMLEVLAAYEVHVGISLDGGEQENDRHRRYTDGRGTYRQVMRGLDLLRSEPYRHLYRRLLCTVDVANDPVRTFDELARLSPPAIDLLLPHATWENPPPAGISTPGSTPYADWLNALFDHWYAGPAQHVQIRFFEELIVQLLGGQAVTEKIGLSPINFLVVETDGTLELQDALKAAYEGAAATGLTLADQPFDAVLEVPAVRANQSGLDGLSATCRACPVVDVCGGGHYAHRYHAETGFDNPSVYCADLAALIIHVRQRVREDLARLAESTQ
ncbi:FxsB family cyclophane-forming radical SAM/SPASM peptide maturase [Actinoallomurus sp. NPDC052308]|uniref:FxsB family cyclophane-forming radical SAM/SPASM peptide maturase n=1 Tax=Actinoallomurus sp. NPDC052308 TaxID=3155530 RepID=UPI003430B913